MAWQFNFYSVALIVTAVICIVVAVAAWRRRPKPGAHPLALIMAAVAIWSFSYALQIASTTLSGKIAAIKGVYVGVVAVPVLWLILALEYTGRDTRWLTRRNQLLFFIEPLFVHIMIWTNPWHGWFWYDAGLQQVQGVYFWQSTHGVAFWIHTVYSYGLLIMGFVLLVQAFLRSERPYRIQAFLLVISALIPWIGNGLSIFGIIRIPMDITPFAFMLSGVATFWALFHYQLLDLVPVARGAAIDSMDDAVVTLDLQNRVVDLNIAAANLLQQPKASVIGGYLRHFIPQYPEKVQQYRTVLKARDTMNLTFNGRTAWYDLRISPLYDHRHRLRGRLLILHDITQERMVAQMRDDLTHTMVHDLRNPLTGIHGALALLTKQPLDDSSEQQHRLLKIAKTNSQRMLRLVNDILDINRLESGHIELRLEPFPLTTVVDEIAGLSLPQSQEKGLVLHNRISPEIPQVCADAQLIGRVLQNLLDNAIKFTPEGGEVHLTAEVRNDKVAISVSDNGPGIPADIQEQLFEKFVTGQQEARGSGLGLAFCRMVMEAHQERIWVASTTGQGATFTFTLPVAEPIEACES